MESLRIVYFTNGRDFPFSVAFELNVKRVSKNIGREVRVTPCFHRRELYEELTNNPNADLVMVHMAGSTSEDAHEIARGVRRIVEEPLLVVESTMYPHGQQELLTSYADYIPLMMLHPKGVSGGLEELLKKHGLA